MNSHDFQTDSAYIFFYSTDLVRYHRCYSFVTFQQTSRQPLFKQRFAIFLCHILILSLILEKNLQSVLPNDNILQPCSCQTKSSESYITNIELQQVLMNCQIKKQNYLYSEKYVSCGVMPCF